MSLSTSSSDKGKWFVFAFLAVFLLLLVAIALFNRLVNPYYIWPGPDMEGINGTKNAEFIGQYRYKPLSVTARKPSYLVIGTSRSDFAIAVDEQDGYNASLPGASLYMNQRLLEHALAKGHLEKVDLFLDFFAFNETGPNSRGSLLASAFDRNTLAPDPGVARSISNIANLLALFSDSLFSGVIFRNSVLTVKNSIQGERKRLVPMRDGSWSMEKAKRPNVRWQRALESWTAQSWFQQGGFCLKREDGSSPNFKALRSLLATLHDNGIRTRLVISPVHARLLVAMERSGLDEQYWGWKQRLVAVNHDVASRLDVEPFEMLDVSLLNQANQSLPGDKYFYDPIHMTRFYGERIMEQLRSGGSGPGKRLTSDNVDNVVLEDRHQYQAYKNSSPGFSGLWKMLQSINHDDYRVCGQPVD